MYKNDVKKAREEGLKVEAKAAADSQKSLEENGAKAQEEITEGMAKTWEDLKAWTKDADE